MHALTLLERFKTAIPTSRIVGRGLRAPTYLTFAEHFPTPILHCWNGLKPRLSEPGFSGLLDFQDYEFDTPNCQSKIEVSSLQRTYDIPNPNPENLLILKILVQTIPANPDSNKSTHTIPLEIHCPSPKKP